MGQGCQPIHLHGNLLLQRNDSVQMVKVNLFERAYVTILKMSRRVSSQNTLGESNVTSVTKGVEVTE
jgi:hypothetical protein